MNTTFYQSPPDYPALVEKLTQLQERYSFAELIPVGHSLLGRTLYAISLGNTRKTNLFAGAFHAQEWLTCSVLVRFVEEMCQTIQAGQKLDGIQFREILQEKGFLVVPMVNPDGVEIALHGAESAGHLSGFVAQIQAQSPQSWQANARGVDLNHNYDAGFLACRESEINHGIKGPSPQQYGGMCPHSEPETDALIHLCERFDVKTVIALHAEGEEIYYEYGEHTPAISRYMASLFASYSGYLLEKPREMACHGGFKDWFIKTYQRPGFTFVIGKGELPLPITDLDPVYEKLRSTLAIASVL